MSIKSHKSTISFSILLLVVYLNISSHALVEVVKRLEENRLLPKAKGTIKTIECPEDGDVIDCIDFWKQPAFDDPLIKESTIKTMELRRSFPKAYETRNESREPIIFHKWNKYGECPKGTIPIKRTPKTNNSSIFHRKVSGPDGYEHEYAMVRGPEGRYHGARAYLNAWKPFVEDDTPEFSIAQLWIVSNVDDFKLLNTIEAGWMVAPMAHGDEEPRLFIYWTRSGYIGSGCYNLDCPGFVASNPQLTFNSALGPNSVYDGQQFEMKIEIERDNITGNWWLHFNTDEIGHWPANIFTTLSSGAERTDFGGEVIFSKVENRHTTTQMGSGHFPEEDSSRAAYFRELQVMNDQRNWDDINPNSLAPFVDKPRCYNLRLGQPETSYRTYFYYGGPGGINCDL